MSPRLQVCGPARQRGAIGLMAALILGLALLFTLLVVDSGRLYLEQRKLQRVVDMAALEAISRGGNCLSGLSAAAYATQSATRNSFTVDANRTLTVACGSLLTGVDNLRTFSVDASKSSAIRVIASHTVATSAAAGIGALFSGSPVSLNTQLHATAVAAEPTPSLAQLSIRSTLISVDTAESNILNPLFSGLLGGNVSLTAAGWNGLLNSNINLLDYLDQLAVDLNVTAGNYTQLLGTTASVAQLIQAAATVSQANGANAQVTTALSDLQVAAANATPVELEDILPLQAGTTSSGLDANLQLYQLMQAIIQLSNSKNPAVTTLPDTVLGLAGVTVRIKVIEPPQFSAVGDPKLAKADPLGANRIYVRTAQVRTMLSVNLPVLSSVAGLSNAALGLVATLTPTINSLLSLDLAATIDSLACLLGAGCEQIDPQLLPSPRIDMILDAGGAITYVTDYSCPVGTTGSKSLTAHTITSMADIKVGQIEPPESAFSSSAEPEVTPLPLIDIGIWTCHKIAGIGSCGPARTAYAAGGIAIMAENSVAQTEQDLVFSSNASPFPVPPNVNLEPSVQSATPSTNIVGSLTSTLAGIDLIVYQPVNGDPWGAVVSEVSEEISGVSNILTPLITSVLNSLIDPLLNNLLASLGINLMDVEVGANLTCGQTGKAYLVI